jgi:ribose 5-phosphate isomerase B
MPRPQAVEKRPFGGEALQPTQPTNYGLGMIRIAAGADHAGVHLKDSLVEMLRTLGHEVIDLGTHGDDRVDYPDYGAAVGRAVVAGTADLGLCVCGSGIGIAIAANKIVGVRAATVHDVTSAHLARLHNDANVVCIGERLTGPEVAKEAVLAFVNGSFEGGRHQDRIDKISALDSAFDSAFDTAVDSALDSTLGTAPNSATDSAANSAAS